MASRLPGPEKRSSSRFLARVLPGAEPSPMSGFVEPCLATLKDEPPRGSRWVHEIKFDGYRVQAHLKDDRPTLFTRSGYDWTARFARIAGAVKELPVNKIILDGEVIVQTSSGASDFGALEADLEAGRQDRFVFYAFDLLYLDGFDIKAAPLVDRKRVLASLLAEAGPSSIAYSEHLEIEGREMFQRAQAMGLEGIVSKRRDSPYRSGRNQGWVKTKLVKREVLTIVGFAINPNRQFRSLHVARHDGKRLIYAGQVGTGFKTRDKEQLIGTLWPLIVEKPTMPVPPVTPRDRWVRPVQMVEIEYRDVDSERLLRHAVFKGLADR